MENGYFYTLSAIAQSFAAIVSLYAIFAIYKLQILKNEKNELIIRLKNIIYEQRGQVLFFVRTEGSGLVF
jgi:hypothetical protein